MERSCRDDPPTAPRHRDVEDGPRARHHVWPGHHIRQQLPITLNDLSEPEPDVLVVPGTPDDYAARHPGPSDARLLVEISDTTLRMDQGRKQRAYARAGIPEYWIVNLSARRLQVYREPTEAGYQSVASYSEGESVAPVAVPHSLVSVAGLLPTACPSVRYSDGSGDGPMARGPEGPGECAGVPHIHKR